MTGNCSARICSLAGTIEMSFTLLVLSSVSAHAQTETLFVVDNKVGIGNPTPSETLHVKATDGSAKVLVEELGGGSFEALVELYNEDGDVGFRLRNSSGLADFNKIGNEFRINLLASPAELTLQADGDLIITGSLTTVNPPGTFPDFVFKPEHELMPLDELRRFVEKEKHLPGVMSAAEIAETGGVNMSRLQLELLEKDDELTLYILKQNDTIEAHQETIRALQAGLEALKQGHHH